MKVEALQGPHVGQFVHSLRGRDSGQIAIIIAVVDQRFVLIADGDKRKFDKPKRKSIKHLVLHDEISDEVVASLMQSGRVTNGKLRFLCQQFIETTLNNAEEKGD